MIEINVAEEFSSTPGGRYISEGPYSGEEFREKHLKPKYMEARESGQKLIVNLDGCFGYPSSFIDESFGGLARKLNDTKILEHIDFVSNDQPNLVNYIKQCVEKG